MNIARWLAVAALSLAALPLHSHHSTANFDNGKEQTIQGTVKYFGFTNPHSFIDLDVGVAGSHAASEAYKVFTVGRVLLVRYGWQVGDMKPGDSVTITGHPDRADPHFMYLTKIVFANGKVWERQTIEQ